MLLIALALPVLAETTVIVFNPLAPDVAYPDCQLINDIVMAELSCADGLKLVDREHLNKLLKEKSLQQNGMLESSSATQVSSLLGADYFISGSIRISDKKMTIFAKALSVKDGVVKMKYVSEDAPFDTVKIARLIASEIVTTIKTQSTKTVDKTEDISLIAPSKARPSVVIILPELHIFRESVIDPAAENTLTQIFIQQKFKVTQPTETITTGKPGAWQSFIGNKSNLLKIAKKANAEYLIYGEAIAEGATVFGDFRTARARVELKAIRTADAQIVFSDSAYAGAADTAEVIAGKRAIQLAAQKLSLKLIKTLLEL